MEHLIFGMLRAGGVTQYMLTRGTGIDYNRFRNAVLTRVRVSEPDAEQVTIPIAPDVISAVNTAVALAASRHDEAAHGVHLLAVLAERETVLNAFLSPFGGGVERLREVLQSTLQYDNAT